MEAYVFFPNVQYMKICRWVNLVPVHEGYINMETDIEFGLNSLFDVVIHTWKPMTTGMIS